MVLVAVDTSSLQGSIALFKDNKFIAEKIWSKQITVGGNPSHSELLTTNFEELLKQNKLTPNDLTHLAVGVGPGSFTGIRVGVNFARALAYAKNLPVFVGDSISIIANDAGPAEKLLVLIPAFRNFLYYGLFLHGQITEGPGVLTDDQLKSSQFEHYQVINNNCPNAKSLGELAMRIDQFKTWREVTPLYIRRSEAEEKFGICL
jgi:tRNA threonylcarbamoyladenosine biosynthesis protein TsaB